MSIVRLGNWPPAIRFRTPTKNCKWAGSCAPRELLLDMSTVCDPPTAHRTASCSRPITRSVHSTWKTNARAAPPGRAARAPAPAFAAPPRLFATPFPLDALFSRGSAARLIGACMIARAASTSPSRLHSTRSTASRHSTAPASGRAPTSDAGTAVPARPLGPGPAPAKEPPRAARNTGPSAL